MSHLRRAGSRFGVAAIRVTVAVAVGVVGLLVLAPAASAHPLNTSAVLLDVGTGQVDARVELPLDQLSTALGEEYTATSVLDPQTLIALRSYVEQHLSASDQTGRGWTTRVTGGRVEQIDGSDDLVLDAVLTPASGRVGDFVLHDDAVLDQLVSHRTFVSGRYGDTGSYTTLAMLSWQTTSVPVAAASDPGAAAAPQSQGFLSAVHLGVEHIGQGSDHLLFLVMLLLPAPLVARGRRWARRDDPGRAGWRVVHVVTAFALGHSITLVLGSLGWLGLPTRLVEAGIALSVLVSAVHAIRPLVARGEVLIAGSFGLLHGLAFATLLGGLHLATSSLATTLLGFNLGIELAQLLVVALVMPSLVVIGRTGLYPVLRTTVAGLGVVLAAAWLAERVGLLGDNPLEPVAELVVTHPVTLTAVLAVLAVGSAVLGGRRPGPQDRSWSAAARTAREQPSVAR